ncbi:MAG: hypothetical protein ABIM89_11570 [Mycobacteriales bacterium]
MGYSRALALLRAGVPLTLLMDLWPAAGPDSADIMRCERAVAVLPGVA